jgi:hypothetical protein
MRRPVGAVKPLPIPGPESIEVRRRQGSTGWFAKRPDRQVKAPWVRGPPARSSGVPWQARSQVAAERLVLRVACPGGISRGGGGRHAGRRPAHPGVVITSEEAWVGWPDVSDELIAKSPTPPRPSPRKIRWRRGIGIGAKFGIRRVAPSARMMAVLGGVQVYSLFRDHGPALRPPKTACQPRHRRVAYPPAFLKRPMATKKELLAQEVARAVARISEGAESGRVSLPRHIGYLTGQTDDGGG